MFTPYYWQNHRIKVSLKWVNKLWWRFMPGKTIRVKWPHGWTEPIPAAGGGTIQLQSADPNDHYRPALEKHVGKQGWDWDWMITDNDIRSDSLTIKFRKGKEKWASYFGLKWS